MIVLAGGLDGPNGVVFHEGALYVTIGEAEEEPWPRRLIELVGRRFVAHAIAAVVREPERADRRRGARHALLYGHDVSRRVSESDLHRRARFVEPQQEDRYRISIVRFDGARPTKYETFAEGWLDGQTSSGRPVDVIVAPDGASARLRRSERRDLPDLVRAACGRGVDALCAHAAKAGSIAEHPRRAEAFLLALSLVARPEFRGEA